MAKVDGNQTFRGTDRFEVKRRLGEGGMGVVYEALDRERGSRVALKTLRRADAKTLYRFKREFRALQDLEHPNLVSLGELVESSGEWFFTMELVDGVDFLSWVRGTEPADARQEHISPSADTLRSERLAANAAPPSPSFDEARLRAALAQLANALAALHGAGRVHRDIKPSNVMVRSDGRVVLLDFGLVAEIGNESTELNAVGTAAYMAPEQAASKHAGPAADWYSVGVVLYEALTGQLPFTGYGLQVLLDKQKHEPAPPRARVPDVPTDLDALCVELLRYDPAGRPPGREILQRLGADETRSLARASTGSEFTQSTPFVGREAELAQLALAANDAREGHPVMFVVQGESGVGKSELVRQFSDHLQRDSPQTVVLKGRCYERESVPYKAFDGIADALSRYLVRLSDGDASAVMPRKAALVGQLFPVLRRVDAVANAPLDTVANVELLERRARMFAAFREMFQRLAERERVVLVIDDLQWADADSLTLLDDLTHSPDAPELLLLATVRSGTQHDELLARVEKLDLDVRKLELGTLPYNESLDLVRQLSPRLASEHPTTAEGFAREADGHPLFLMEMIRHAEDEGITDGAMRLDDALWSRVARLPPPARRLLEVLCVAGAPIARSVAGDAAKQATADTDRAASLLRVAHLARASGARDADTVEPYHDRVAEAVVNRMDEDTRRAVHASVARALARAGADPQLLVRHLEYAGEHQRAAEHAERAAETAMRALAFDRAADLYRTALDLGTHSVDRQRELLLLTANALVNAARGGEAAEVFRRAAEGADPATRLECRRQAAEQLLSSGRFERGLEEMESVLGEVGLAMAKTPKRALLSILWNRTKLKLRGTRWKRVHEAQVAPEQLTRLDVYKSASHGIAMVDNIRGHDFHTRRLLLALKIGEPIRVAEAFAMEAGFLASVGRPPNFDHARRVSDDSMRAAEMADADNARTLALLGRGFVEYFGSRFADAADYLGRSEALARDYASGWELSTAGMFRLFSLRMMGAFEATRSAMDDFLRDAARRGDTYAETTMRRALAVTLRLADDDPQRGRDELNRATWVPPQHAFHVQHYYELRARSELALYDGSARDELARLQPDIEAANHSLLTRNQFIRVTTSDVHGRLLLCAASDASDRERHLKTARRIARSLMKEKVGFALVYGELLFAGIAAREAQPETAASHLRAAVEVAEANDMALHSAAAKARLGKLLGGSEGDALCAAAAEWMSAQRIANPDRMIELAAPGFNSSGD